MNAGSESDQDAVSADHDELLADLLCQLTERHARGEVIDVGQFSQAHPEHAKELRELWGRCHVGRCGRQPHAGQRSVRDRTTTGHHVDA